MSHFRSVKNIYIYTVNAFKFVDLNFLDLRERKCISLVWICKFVDSKIKLLGLGKEDNQCLMFHCMQWSTVFRDTSLINSSEI